MMPFSSLLNRCRILPVCLCVVGLASGAIAAEETWETLEVEPSTISLEGADAAIGLLVHGSADGRWRDLTHEATYESTAPQIANVDSRGRVVARGDGNCEILVRVGQQTLRRQVEVRRSDWNRPLDFAHDVVPILSKFGCNSSACHGKAEGQNGFKLSVFGFNPAADHAALLRESRGRRVFVRAPEQSLLLAKASGETPHGGGARIGRGTVEYQTIRRWIAEGAVLEIADTPQLLKLELLPKDRVLSIRGRQQLRAFAVFEDGRRVDVSRAAKFDSNYPALAQVDAQGLVTVGEAPGQAAIMASYMGRVARFRILIPRDGESLEDAQPRSDHFIDRAIHKQLQKLNIAASGLAEDSKFLRRAHLDIIGKLPTVEEARRFLLDKSPDKRARLVDALLERPEYAEYWALKWADILRVDRRALGHKNAHAYYRWIRQQFQDNTTFDRFATDVITSTGPLKASPQGHFFSVVKGAGAQASTLSQVFLGVRIACAECHHHPFDRWSQSDYQGMASYFTSLKQGPSALGTSLFTTNSPAVRKHPRTGENIAAHPLGQSVTDDSPATGDVRPELAAWLTGADNPWFARATVNRYWAHCFGRGIVEPVDDFRDTNPPSNPELLDALADSFIQSGYDLKQLIRTITASHAYQRQSQPNPTNVRDEQNYSRRLFKRLEAEVLLDAISQVTGTSDKFQGMPGGFRAVQLWDSEVSDYFLKQFGRPQRKTACECERTSAPNVGQVLHLLNSQELADKIAHAGGSIAKLERAFTDDEPLVEQLYLAALSRTPTEQERTAAVAYLRDASPNRRRNAEDLLWALINSVEFVFNH